MSNLILEERSVRLPLGRQPADSDILDFAEFASGERMYAIAFDMDIEALRSYGDPYNNAYGDIKRVLVKHGFIRQQGSVYFGDPQKINAVTCVLAAMDLSRTLPWFSTAVRDIRMLRIEEQNDLLPAVKQAAE